MYFSRVSATHFLDYLDLAHVEVVGRTRRRRVRLFGKREMLRFHKCLIKISVEECWGFIGVVEMTSPL